MRPRDTFSERDLVERFQVSRTPVREAIKRLHERGFVQHGPKRVAVVRDVNRKEVEDLYALRLKVEDMAARLTARNITPAELTRLRALNRDFSRAWKARDLGHMLDLRAQFHAVLVEATRNRWLAKVCVILRDDAYAVRHAHWQEPERARQSIDLHRGMIDALAAGEGARYRALVLEQIRGGLASYQARM